MTTEIPGNSSPRLSFDTDPGASRSFWLALILLLLIVGWMASGLFVSKAPSDGVATAETQPPLVVVRKSHAESVGLSFRAEGQAEPDRDTAVRAGAEGNVVELVANKGDNIEAGAVIARLSADEAKATMMQAQEDLARAQRELDNANQLRDRGVATTDRVSDARTAMAAAQAQLTAAETALSDLVITAPFTGRIEALPIHDGEYISIGEEVARVVDNDPLTVAIQIPQQSLNLIKVGQTAQVNFITGQEKQGIVSFVGTAANNATRTFLAEIEISNPDGQIPAGISAGITIPTGEKTAHFIEPSIISLGPEGEPGVKIEQNGIVRFIPVEIVNAGLKGVWASGLPDEVNIVTIGQGFVRDGEAVRAQYESARSDNTDTVSSGKDDDQEVTKTVEAPR